MKIDGSIVLIFVLIVALAVFGIWQYHRTSAIKIPPADPNRISVPPIF
jgi:hypothetical protein